MFKKAYHIEHGEKEMYEVDANAAIREFPDEWSDKPWPAKKSEPKTPEPPAKKYVAKHRGQGSYSVMDADGAEVLEKLTKEDAELFNAGTVEEQEAFIEAEKAKRASS